MRSPDWPRRPPLITPDREVVKRVQRPSHWAAKSARRTCLSGALGEYSVPIGQKMEVMAGTEVMGSTDEVRRWSKVVRQAGGTGRHGDGVVNVVAVAESSHLRGSPGYGAR